MGEGLLFLLWEAGGPDFPDLECSEVGIQKLRPNYEEGKAAGNWTGQGSLAACP